MTRSEYEDRILGKGKHAIFTIAGDGCVRDGECVTSKNYPNNYGSNEACTIRFKGSGIWFEGFDVEPHATCNYDALTINGNKHCGSVAPVAVPTGPIEWKTDGSVVKGGWKLCPSGLVTSRTQAKHSAMTLSPGHSMPVLGGKGQDNLLNPKGEEQEVQTEGSQSSIWIFLAAGTAATLLAFASISVTVYRRRHASRPTTPHIPGPLGNVSGNTRVDVQMKMSKEEVIGTERELDTYLSSYLLTCRHTSLLTHLLIR